MNSRASITFAHHSGSSAEADNPGAAGALAHNAETAAADALHARPGTIRGGISRRRVGILAQPAHGHTTVTVVNAQNGGGASFRGSLHAGAATAAAEDARAAAQGAPWRGRHRAA